MIFQSYLIREIGRTMAVMLAVLVTLFASYNGVRSDSVQFSFPAACNDHDHLYHGRQVNNQVPPL